MHRPAAIYRVLRCAECPRGPEPGGIGRPAATFRALVAPAIRELASSLAVALFVGRPDPALRAPGTLASVSGR